MLLHSALVFSFVIFNGPILALPSTHSSSESSSGTPSLLNRQLLSKSSSTPPISHQREKRGFLRKSTGQICDSTFYKQNKLDVIMKKICKEPTSSPKSKFVRETNKDLKRLFPNAYGELTMVLISNKFFTSQRIKNLLGKSRNYDYVVLDSNCNVVGYVRKQRSNQLTLCKSNVSPKFPVPTRPDGAGLPVPPTSGSPPGGFPVPTRPEGAGLPTSGSPPGGFPVPTRPEGAGSVK